MNTSHQPLVNRLLRLLPVPPTALALGTGALLALPLLLMAGATPQATAAGVSQSLWRLAMAPAIVAFILAVHPRLQDRWRLAIEQLRPLCREPALIDRAYQAYRPGEIIALGLAAALAFWISASMRVSGGLYAYTLATNLAMFSLLALSIHEGLRRTRHLKHVVAAGLALDLFDRPLLMPLARFGQALSLTFVGGICLSLIFQSATGLYSVQSLVIYSILIVVALTLFFSSIWSIHVALVVAQERELVQVRQHWARSRHELHEQLARAGAPLGADEAARLYQPVVVLGTYERMVAQASTWPFNPKIVKQVAASLVAPILIYGLKVAMGLSGQL